VRIDVVDTGVGIAQQHQARVFEEFYQVEPSGRQASRGTRGMGLGLATVQRLAELLNTRVELSSRVNRGTCVRVLVRSAPAGLPAPAAAAQPVLENDAHCLAGLRILVIDDERTILEGLTVVLSNWGAEVLAAQTRAEALALADLSIDTMEALTPVLLQQAHANANATLAPR